MSFSYGQFVFIGLVLYVGFGIFAGQRLRVPRALIAIVLAALIDASLGSYVAARIGPGATMAPGRTVEIVGVALLGALLNVVLGALGVAVGARVARRAT
ncbi:MAG: hypothetical protein JOZ01_07735 [Candidatus Eremiobacteraeota bacterium]|nr:hypothetical protein [Candidatus Eremiobacteraeota bacterium]